MAAQKRMLILNQHGSRYEAPPTGLIRGARMRNCTHRTEPNAQAQQRAARARPLYHDFTQVRKIDVTLIYEWYINGTSMLRTCVNWGANIVNKQT